jgi:hypothetical protein
MVYCLWGRVLRASSEGDIKKQEKHFITKVSYFPSYTSRMRAEKEIQIYIRARSCFGAAAGVYLFIALEREKCSLNELFRKPQQGARLAQQRRRRAQDKGRPLPGLCLLLVAPIHVIHYRQKAPQKQNVVM